MRGAQSLQSPKGPVLVVFAKAPEPGRVKTRLVPPLSAELAAEFYAAMLDDVLEESAAAAEALGLSSVLAVDPPEAMAQLLSRAPNGFLGREQRGPDLGARLAHAASELFAEGYGPVLIRGSDSPCVPRRAVGEALEALAKAELVIAPDQDGGYHLIGLNRPIEGLFDFAMSHPGVLETSLARARDDGARVVLLPVGRDIDTPADFEQLRDSSSQPQARRSQAFASRHDLWRFLPSPTDGAAQTSRID